MDSKIVFLVLAAIVVVFIIAVIAIVIPLTIKAKGDDESNMTPMEKARKWMKETPLIDGHNDLPWQIKVKYDNVLSRVDLNEREGGKPGHTDIPRLREGLVGAQFWSTATICDSQYKDASLHLLDQIDVTKRFTEKYSDTFEFVTTAQGIRDAFQNGKIASLIGIEGGHHIDSQMASLRMFYELGARYMTLTHNCNTPWADNWQVDKPSETPEFDGLSSFGERIVREMNRLGMLVDLSHTSKETMLDVLNLPNVPPVMFSHTAAFSLCNYHRNVQDEVIEKVKENGGVIHVGFYTPYINCPPTNVSNNRSYYAVLGQVADHIEHIKSLCGVECVGLGSDFDGADTLPLGLEDVSKFPNLIADLIERGWSESDIKALLGNNILRVFEQVEKFAADAKARSVEPDDTTIPREDLRKDNYTQCRTFLYNP